MCKWIAFNGRMSPFGDPKAGSDCSSHLGDIGLQRTTKVMPQTVVGQNDEVARQFAISVADGPNYTVYWKRECSLHRLHKLGPEKNTHVSAPYSAHVLILSLIHI